MIDFGAGHGYWSYLLTENGVDSIAVDNVPVETGKNQFFTPEPDFLPFSWAPIIRDEARFVRKNGKGRTLLLAWPPMLSSMALHALQQFSGDTLVYVGPRNPDFCASASFFEVLARDWDEIEDVALPSFFGMDDHFYVYRRRQA